jgi:LuxR family maltose regulon positive regulatory protein
MLSRPRLFERLDTRGKGKQITLVTAPPGYGKTSLVSHWLTKSKVKASWLTLDENDTNGMTN